MKLFRKKKKKKHTKKITNDIAGGISLSSFLKKKKKMSFYSLELFVALWSWFFRQIIKDLHSERHLIISQSSCLRLHSFCANIKKKNKITKQRSSKVMICFVIRWRNKLVEMDCLTFSFESYFFINGLLEWKDNVWDTRNLEKELKKTLEVRWT